MNSFANPSQHGLYRVGISVPCVALGQPHENVGRHLEMMLDAVNNRVKYLLFPELSLCGYSLGDLHLSEVIEEEVMLSLQMLAEHSNDAPYNKLLFTVGAPIVVDGKIFNCGVTIGYGKILSVVPKSYLPNYREFYEHRHFAAARHAHVKLVTIAGQEVPFGTDILLKDLRQPDFVLGMDICEDLWVSVPPSTIAALNGATVLANLSASDITIGKDEYRQKLVENSSSRNLCVQMYVAAGFGESTMDMSWDGDGYVAENGNVLVRTQRFAYKSQYVATDVDLSLLKAERKAQSTWRENSTDYARPFRVIEFILSSQEDEKRKMIPLMRTFERHPFAPDDKATRDKRCSETFEIQAHGLIRKLVSLPEQNRQMVIGVSGGQDSTHVLLLAAHAVDKLGLPRKNIIAVTMPGLGTTDRTYQNACALIKAIGATFMEINISNIAMELMRVVGHDSQIKDVTFENSQAWARKYVELMAAAEFKGLVLGTGDESEIAQGWCTMFGDHAGHYNVNSGVVKTLISYLIAWVADTKFIHEPVVQATLADILGTPISAELLPGDEKGNILQMTEDKIGPYELLDFYLRYLTRYGYKPSKIAFLAMHAYNDYYDLATIKKWLRSFIIRFFASQYKRNVAMEGPKVGLTSLSPRGDWRAPSEVVPSAWLANLDTVPDKL